MVVSYNAGKTISDARAKQHMVFLHAFSSISKVNRYGKGSQELNHNRDNIISNSVSIRADQKQTNKQNHHYVPLAIIKHRIRKQSTRFGYDSYLHINKNLQPLACRQYYLAQWTKCECPLPTSNQLRSSLVFSLPFQTYLETHSSTRTEHTA